MDNTFLSGLCRTLRIVLMGEGLRRIFRCARQLPVRDDALLLLVVWAAAVWVFYRLYSRRERNAENYLYFGAALVLAEVAAAELWLRTSPGFFGWFYSAALSAFAVYSAAEMQSKPTPAARDVLAFEGGAALLLFTLLLVSAGRMTWVSALPSILAAVMALGLVLAHRLSGVTDGSEHGAGRALWLLIPSGGLIAAAAAVFACWGAEPYARGVTALADGVWTALKTLGGALLRFIAWLASLLPDAEGELPPAEAAAGIAGEPVAEAAADISGALLGALLLLLAAAAFFFLFKTLRGRRQGGRVRAQRAASVRRQRQPLGARLRELWNSLVRRVRLSLRVRKCRGSIREMYYYLLRQGRRAGQAIRGGETPMEYVLRLCAGMPETVRSPAGRLSRALETELYSPVPAEPLPREDRLALRRAFRFFPLRERRKRA